MEQSGVRFAGGGIARPRGRRGNGAAYLRRQPGERLPEIAVVPSWREMAVLLSGSGLSKSFGARVLFEDLSIGLSEDDRTGLIGPNGSGKTTLLEILAGNETPDTGTRAL